MSRLLSFDPVSASVMSPLLESPWPGRPPDADAAARRHAAFLQLVSEGRRSSFEDPTCPES